MLHSSVLIRCILSLLSNLGHLYDNSLIHRVLVALGRGLRNLFLSSAIIRFFGNFDQSFHQSWTYFLLRFVFRLLNTIITWVRIRVFNLIQESKIGSFVSSFGRLDFFLPILGLLSLGFGLSLMVSFVISRRIHGLIGLVFILVGTVCLLLTGSSQSKIKSSKFVQVVSPLYRLFLTDEEAQEWKF